MEEGRETYSIPEAETHTILEAGWLVEGLALLFLVEQGQETHSIPEAGFFFLSYALQR